MLDAVERRASTRYQVWFPMSVDSSSVADGMAVSRNMSPSGLLMATASSLEPNAPVKLTFQLSLDDPTEHSLAGRVVRVEPNRDDPDGMWPHFVAVVFEQPVPELEPVLAQLAAANPAAD